MLKAETIPCRNPLQGDHDGAYVMDCIVGVPSDGEHGVSSTQVGPSRPTQPLIPIALSPGLATRVSVQILHANQESLGNQAFAQLPMKPVMHALKIKSQWIARAHPKDKLGGPFRVADSKEGVCVPVRNSPVEPWWSPPVKNRSSDPGRRRTQEDGLALSSVEAVKSRKMTADVTPFCCKRQRWTK